MKKIFIYNNKIMLTIFTSLFFIICIIGSIQRVCADERLQYDKSFESIEIQSGDTLLSIAKKYALSEDEYSSYIAEVKSINNLYGDTIHAGCYLVIPVYESNWGTTP